MRSDLYVCRLRYKRVYIIYMRVQHRTERDWRRYSCQLYLARLVFDVPLLQAESRITIRLVSHTLFIPPPLFFFFFSFSPHFCSDSQELSSPPPESHLSADT